MKILMLIAFSALLTSTVFAGNDCNVISPVFIGQAVSRFQPDALPKAILAKEALEEKGYTLVLDEKAAGLVLLYQSSCKSWFKTTCEAALKITVTATGEEHVQSTADHSTEEEALTQLFKELPACRSSSLDVVGNLSSSL